jgi:hypothetical protein
MNTPFEDFEAPGVLWRYETVDCRERLARIFHCLRTSRFGLRVCEHVCYEGFVMKLLPVVPYYFPLSFALAFYCSWQLASVATAEITIENSRFSHSLTLLEDAQWLPNGRLRLTPSQPSRVGAAWLQGAVPVANNFSLEMDFRISANDGEGLDRGGDGIAVVFRAAQPQSGAGLKFGGREVAQTVGLTNGGIGYCGIARSVAIEFDTWQNIPYDDPNNNHVAIHTNAMEQNRSEARWNSRDVRQAVSTEIPNLKASSKRSIRVEILRSGGRLEVFVWKEKSPRPSSPAVSVSDSILTELGAEELNVGVTAATGGSWSNHDIMLLRFRDIP